MLLIIPLLFLLSWVWIGSGCVLRAEAAAQETLQAAEDAVAQAMVISAQVRVPVSIVRAYEHNLTRSGPTLQPKHGRWITQQCFMR